MVQTCQIEHTVFDHNCKYCKSLQNEWYSYLENTGFTDIENAKGDIRDHKNTLDLVAKKDFQTSTQFEAKQSYYQWARSKLNDGRFDSDISKLIWEDFSDGVSTRQIGTRLGIDQSWVVRKIKKTEEYLEAQSTGSGASQLDLFFWGAPWNYFKWKSWNKKRQKAA